MKLDSPERQLAIAKTATALKGIAGEDAHLEAKWLYDFCTNEQQLNALVARRQSGEPLQYLLGEWEFFGLPIRVSPAVLIPRADTETLVEHAIEAIKKQGYKTCLDACTGSGCVAIAIASRTGIAVSATDISKQAIDLAKQNACLNGVDICFMLGDLLCGTGKYDIIVCNPPYLSKMDMHQLQKEVSYEPRLALYGGEDGLDFYRRLRADYGEHLNDGGVLMMEIGSTQADAIKNIFGTVTIVKDICNNDRVAICTL